MISDLMAIEFYLGRLEAVMTLEDMIRRYGEDAVHSAIKAEEIELKCSFCKVYALLSDRVRQKRAYEGAC